MDEVIFMQITSQARLIIFMLLVPIQYVMAIDDPLYPTYPNIPAEYETLDAGALLHESMVNFGFEPVVENTDGYKVTSPDGNTFYVDNVDKPSCAFYATYVSNNEEDPGTIGGLEVFSNVYIEEVNFENCQ
jgi:hypothetical protein